MAENKDGQEKTEPATAKRLAEARNRGQVSKSQDVTTAAVLLIGTIIVFIFGKPMLANIQYFMTEIFRKSTQIQITDHTTPQYFSDFMLFLANILLPILVSIFAVVLISEISQVGLKIASKKFTEGLNKQIFNPFAGLKKIFFSTRSLFELIKSLLKLILMGGIVYWVLSDKADETALLIEKPYFELGSFIAKVSMELIIKVGIVYILIAVADFLWQKHKFKEDMKMTKQEVKEEVKQSEGDPKIKARLRSLMRGRIRSLMLKNVKKSDVVITNPTHFAVALSYKPTQNQAPIVVAKGLDYLAVQIRELATEAGIPIVEEPPLARALYYTVEVEQEIPEELFKAVAQVLAYVYSLKRKLNSSIQDND